MKLDHYFSRKIVIRYTTKNQASADNQFRYRFEWLEAKMLFRTFVIKMTVTGVQPKCILYSENGRYSM